MADANGLRSVCYFVNWAIYGRNHFPQQLPVDKLTHVLYAFANVRADSGEVFLTDSWADTDKHFDGDSWNDPGGPNLYGCLKQLNILKARNRNLKILLSIGGWTYSSNFAVPASTEQGRKRFAESAVRLLLDHGFDGIDVDWEYPKNAAESNDFTRLLQETRNALDEYARHSHPKHPFLLTIACPAGPENYKKLHLAELARVVDFFNLMAYDFSGSWETNTSHQANWYPSRDRAGTTPFSTSNAIEFYKSQGVHSKQIVVGMPLYGRAFANTDGLGSSFSGTGPGSWEQGVWDYKDLPRPGSTEHEDLSCISSWCHDHGNRTIVSYDNMRIAEAKATEIVMQDLGGAMWWESSGDKTAEDSLISKVDRTFRAFGKSPEFRQNHLKYGDSKYENLRKGNLAA